MDWLDSVAGPGYTAAVLWTLAALVALVVVLVIIKIIKSLTAGTFVTGGRNRKTRLAVMDATAVDTHRRLVLVRRDDVEHLILIGGPNDVVVETDIRMAPSKRPDLTASAAPQSAPRPRPQESAVQRQPAPATPAPPQRPAPIAAPVRQEPALRTPPATPQTYSATPPPQRPAAAPRQAADDRDIDARRLRDLEVQLDEQPAAQKPSPADEMSRLLGELTRPKR
ncbi:flagellar biosynthetic protein FliO [Corticibacterium sp. UT-5YL-CI-8]|nr:flagellar biosynthetic protein FliO [Tianweitania sp. UT-5YL-CI-8]